MLDLILGLVVTLGWFDASNIRAVGSSQLTQILNFYKL